jgi:hypothetical protein
MVGIRAVLILIGFMAIVASIAIVGMVAGVKLTQAAWSVLGRRRRISAG